MNNRQVGGALTRRAISWAGQYLRNWFCAGVAVACSSRCFATAFDTNALLRCLGKPAQK